MASNPLPLLAAAAGAFFLMKAAKKSDEKPKEEGWEDYKPGDDTPIPEITSTDTFTFATLRAQPIELTEIDGDGNSVTVTEIPDGWEYKVDLPAGYATAYAGTAGVNPDRFVGIQINRAEKKVVAVVKNYAEARQLAKDHSSSPYIVQFKAVDPTPFSMDAILVYFSFPPSAE